MIHSRHNAEIMCRECELSPTPGAIPGCGEGGEEGPENPAVVLKKRKIKELARDTDE